MRRTILLRILTAAWGFWFAAAFLELPVVHACAVHGAHGAATTGAHAHMHHQSAPTKGQHCTCLSQCCGTSPAALLTPAVAVASATTEPATAVFRAPAAVIVAARAYARPFANGPPVA